MKNIFSKQLFVLLVVVLAFAACKKDYKDDYSLAPNPSLATSAYFKVYNATTGASRNFVYLPTVTTPTPLTGLVFAYGATSPSSNAYFAVGEGQTSILVKDTLATSTQAPIIAVGTFTRGKYYSLFTYDTTITIKTKLVEDNLVIPTDTTAMLRFANFVRSGSAIPNFDLFSTAKNGNLYTNVALNDVTPFIPFRTAISDTVYVRPTGTSTNVAGIVFTAAQKRSYTLLFRGRYDTYAPVTPVTTPAATATVPKTLTLFTSY